MDLLEIFIFQKHYNKMHFSSQANTVPLSYDKNKRINKNYKPGRAPTPATYVLRSYLARRLEWLLSVFLLVYSIPTDHMLHKAHLWPPVNTDLSLNVKNKHVYSQSSQDPWRQQTLPCHNSKYKDELLSPPQSPNPQPSSWSLTNRVELPGLDLFNTALPL